MPTLITIRGNSGSGKTTLADQLATLLPPAATLVLHQDMLRRDLLHADDHPGTPAVPLIATLADFGFQHYRYTIIEGILRRDVYGAMLQQVATAFAPRHFGYYLALPFAVTVARDAQRPQPFGEATLHRWWQEADQLPGDRLLDATATTTLAEQIAAEVTDHE